MSRRVLRVVLALVVAVVGAVGTSPVHAQSPSPAAASAASEPRSSCELLDAEETAEALGLPISEGQDLSGVLMDESGWLTHCAFFGGSDPPVPLLEVTLASGPGFIDWFGELALEAGVEPVEDLGDEALLGLVEVWGLDQPVGSLHVRVGETVIGLQLGVAGILSGGVLEQLGDGPRQAALLVELAKMTLRRLDPASIPSADVCRLLPVADASALVAADLATAQDVAENDDWGPACHYATSDDRVLLFLGVSSDAAVIAHAESCAGGGAPVAGVGEQAFIATGGSGCGAVFVGSYFIEGPLVARSGETVLVVAAVGEQLGVNATGSRETQVAVARWILGALGLDPGATPAPFDATVLDRPCDLLTPADVGEIVGVAITRTDGYPRDALTQGASCLFQGPDVSVPPLTLTLSAGEEAMETWASYGTYRKGAKVPAEGLGDGAWSEATERYGFDVPLVTLWVLHGEVLLQLDLGSVERRPDYTERAPGTPEEQLAMLRAIAELILPRLSG